MIHMHVHVHHTYAGEMSFAAIDMGHFTFTRGDPAADMPAAAVEGALASSSEGPQDVDVGSGSASTSPVSERAAACGRSWSSGSLFDDEAAAAVRSRDASLSGGLDKTVQVLTLTY